MGFEGRKPRPTQPGPAIPEPTEFEGGMSVCVRAATTLLTLA
jgi:hypothetical protein